MPLKLTRRADSSVWWITGTVGGQRIRRSTGTADRRLAEGQRADLEARQHREQVFGAKAVVTWEDAVASYMDANPPSNGTAIFLLRLTSHIGKAPLKDIGQTTVDAACKALVRPGAAPATKLRNVIVPMRAVLNHAARRGWCDPPLFETPKGATGRKRERWLTPDEFRALHREAAPHLRSLLTFLVCTGARLSEALELDWSRVDLGRRQAKMRVKDPADPDRWRTAALPTAAVVALWQLPHVDGPVFRTPAGRPYADHGRQYGGQIDTAFAAACRRAELAPGVTPHVLRHTYASWHYCVWRDLLRLRDDGDWSSTAIVERYAKVTPEAMRPGVLAAWGMTQADLR
jgi:integrase